jgi:L-threonylcarbamoyladenylate synthase
MSQPQVTEIIRTDSAEQFERAVQLAATFLKHGQVVAVPTETVYGLAANALNPDAVTRLFEAKGRPSHNPIIVHVASLAMARGCVSHWPASAEVLATRFWPGPLTLVLPKSSIIPSLVTAGGPTVGVRWPKHPFMRALIDACGFPLAAPSANLSSRISPTEAAHVMRGLSGKIPLVVDAGATLVGIESTVVDLTSEPPRVLRPGMISENDLNLILQVAAGPATADAGPLRSPGLLTHHYAPQARLVVARWTDAEDLSRQLARFQVTSSEVFVLAHTQVPDQFAGGQVIRMPPNAVDFAQRFYAELHRCDTAGARLIVVERLPESVEWQGIIDRLQRAATLPAENR